MGVTVLNMDLVCEDSSHTVAPMGPNTCITPGVVAGAPGPIPYPLVNTTGSLDKGTDKVQQAGKKTLNADGKTAGCSGNEPGSQNDITTGKTKGKAWGFPVPAVTVQFEGAVALVTGSPGMENV